VNVPREDLAGRRAAKRAAARLARAVARLTTVGAIALGVVVTMTPANGAAEDTVAHFTNDSSASDTAAKIARPEQLDGISTAAVGALFTSANGKLGSHFCTASVVDSPHGDLAITAAHCVAEVSGPIAFVPGYHSGIAPFGIWQVVKVYTHWVGPDDDIAFLKLSQPDSVVPIEDVTGAETLGSGRPTRQLVEVVGYPDGSSLPIGCVNWTSEPMPGQLQFNCVGYTIGSSGGPLLADFDARTGQGTVIGVIGGYQQGGDMPQVSYSSQFGSNVTALFAAAVAGS
jgi:V8-like Glu-specific endopeptidase